MEMKVLKTNQMDQKTKEMVCQLFQNVFDMEKTYEQFVMQFENNELGYSYFGLIYDNHKLVGSYAVIPFYYVYFGEKMIFGQSVDTMIDEKYRGNPFLLKKLAEKVYKLLKEDGIPFVFGFPNENIYLVRKKILKWRDIDNLDIYLLPIRIDKVKSILKPLNILTIGLSKVLNTLVGDKVDNTEVFSVYKEYSSEFENYRYRDLYKKIVLDENVDSYYKIQDFKNIRTAFIVDVYPLTKKNLELAVKKICLTEKDIDLIAYFGHLSFSPINMFKVPEKIKPKNTFMSGKILNEDIVDESIFDVKNWRTNLSNFDWI